MASLKSHHEGNCLLPPGAAPSPKAPSLPSQHPPSPSSSPDTLSPPDTPLVSHRHNVLPPSRQPRVDGGQRPRGQAAAGSECGMEGKRKKAVEAGQPRWWRGPPSCSLPSEAGAPHSSRPAPPSPYLSHQPSPASRGWPRICISSATRTSGPRAGVIRPSTHPRWLLLRVGLTWLWCPGLGEMKAQQAERQPPVLSRPLCQGLSRIPSTHHASWCPPRLEMRSHGGEVDLPKAIQIEVRLEFLPRPGSGQSQWTLFSVGPRRSPFNVNLGLGANLTRWRHPDPCSLAWPVDKEQRGFVPRAGSGQAGRRGADSK